MEGEDDGQGGRAKSSKAGGLFGINNQVEDDDSTEGKNSSGGGSVISALDSVLCCRARRVADVPMELLGSVAASRLCLKFRHCDDASALYNTRLISRRCT